MRTLFYHYNRYGNLVFDYTDEHGRRIDRCYIFYSFREALQRFRREFGLQRKPIQIVRLYGGR